MSQQIEIPVTYKGQQIIYEATLLQRGYLHAFQININDIPVLFETDEERNYRVIIDTEKNYKIDKLDAELLQVIVARLQSLSKDGI